MKHFRDQLRTDNRFNPFNKNFDFDLLKKAWSTWLPNTDQSDITELKGLKDTCTVLPLIHEIYIKVQQRMDIYMARTGLSFEQLIEVLVAQHNASHLFVIGNLRVGQQAKSDLQFSDTFAHQTPSLDPGIGNINTGGGLATLIDTLQITINRVLAKGETYAPGPTVSDPEAMFWVDQLTKNCNIYFAFKVAYESAVWNGGYFEDLGEGKIRVYFRNKEKLVLEEIGRFRLQQDSLATYLQLSELFSQPGKIQQFEPGWNVKLKKDICLAAVTISEGYITYSLTKGVDQTATSSHVNLYAALKTYYPFLENASFPAFVPLQLWDVILLFELVAQLFSKVAENTEYTTEIPTIKDLLAHPFRIKKQELSSYLEKRTSYSAEVISQFLQMITPVDNWINFWNWPFLSLNDDLLVPLLTVTAANTFHQIDRWLDLGGCNLDWRGAMLEKHIIQQLAADLKKKGFWFNIPNTQYFITRSGLKEEIDLIINLSDIVIIAKVKCIKYPMEIRDYYNNYERLRKGSSQIIRKAAFIESHAEEFSDVIGIIEGKKIVKLVVTNYPIFAGCVLDDVPVVDFHWLEGYFKHRHLIQFHSQADDGIIKNEVEKFLELYSSETEFNEHLEEQMRHPALIESFKTKVELKDIKMSFEDFPLSLYQEIASFKP